MTHHDAILAAIRGGAQRRTDILAALAEQGIACTLPQFYAALNRLLSSGVIERRGTRRGTTYAAREATA